MEKERVKGTERQILIRSQGGKVNKTLPPRDGPIYSDKTAEERRLSRIREIDEKKRDGFWEGYDEVKTQ